MPLLSFYTRYSVPLSMNPSGCHMYTSSLSVPFRYALSYQPLASSSSARTTKPVSMCHGNNLCICSKVALVGCIYASYPQCKSNIFQCLFNSFKLLSKHQKLLKNIFLNFSVFLLTFVRVSFHFFCSTYCTKICILLPPRGLIPSREALTSSLAQPDKLAVHQLRR